MKILKSMLAVFLALFLISNVNQEKAGRLADKSENVIHHCDHSECKEAIAILQRDLAEAQKSCDLILRVEIEFIPGLFGEWARVDFHSSAIAINSACADALQVGDDLYQAMDSDFALAEKLIACRIIVESISPNQ